MTTNDLDWQRLQKALIGPYWRQDAAQALSPRRALRSDVDPLVLQLYEYQQEQAQAPPPTTTRYPAIEAAVLVNRADDVVVESLQLLSLAGATSQQIAARTGLEELVINTWQSLFFDIGDWREASDWLFHVVERARWTNPRRSSRMRFAITAGLVGLDALLAAETKLPADEAGQLEQRRLRLFFLAAESFDALARTPENDIELMKLYANQRASEQLRELVHPTPRRTLPVAPLLSLQWGASSKSTSAADGGESVGASDPWQQVLPFGTAAERERDNRHDSESRQTA